MQIETGAKAIVKFVERENMPSERIVLDFENGEYVWRFVNYPEVLAGDRPTVVTGGRVLVTRKHRRPNLVKLSNGNYAVYVDRSGPITLKVWGKPASRITFRARCPELPGPPSQFLLGPLFPHHRIPDGMCKGNDLDRYFVAADHVYGTGCNHMALVPFASWHHPGDIDETHYPFASLGGRDGMPLIYDLAALDETWFRATRCLMWRAARQGCAITWYPYEYISSKYGYMWRRNPLNWANNINRWINRDAPDGYRTLNDCYIEGEPAEMREYLRAYVQALVGNVDPALRPYVHFGCMQEAKSRSADIKIGEDIGQPYGVRHPSLWRDRDWPAMEDHLANDQKWRTHLGRAEFVALQSCCFPENTARLVSRLLPFARNSSESQYGLDFKIEISGDGDGQGDESGKARVPDGSRPNDEHYVEATVIAYEKAGKHFRGTELKSITAKEGEVTDLVGICSDVASGLEAKGIYDKA